ncbi:evasin P1096-like [Ixodes scapularis]|uniref:evasin P1096-like n=1 Tax=Ixodes scapularis TaxID=6945 RepID=UPI001AA001A8|nr:evasin P1096-like [Ixodes scapularis]
MELNAFTILQIAVFIAVGYHANTHTAAAGSEEKKPSNHKEDIYVAYCGMNCTVKNGVSSACSTDCICVHRDDEPNGICITITYFGHLGDPNEDPNIDDATPLAPVFQTEE